MNDNYSAESEIGEIPVDQTEQNTIKKFQQKISHTQYIRRDSRH